MSYKIYQNVNFPFPYYGYMTIFRYICDHRILLLTNIISKMGAELTFAKREDFQEWLKNYGQTSEGVWLLFGKTKTLKTLSAEEALEEALCFGWIDGLINSIDEHRYKKYFSKRRKGSKWSEKNKKIVEKLIKEGRMTGFGLQAIEEAKRSGEWEKVRDRNVTDTQKSEFESLIKNYDLAYTNYLTTAKSTQNNFVGFYFEAKREDTRLKRLEKIIGLLKQNKKLM